MPFSVMGVPSVSQRKFQGGWGTYFFVRIFFDCSPLMYLWTAFFSDSPNWVVRLENKWTTSWSIHQESFHSAVFSTGLTLSSSSLGMPVVTIPQRPPCGLVLWNWLQVLGRNILVTCQARLVPAAHGAHRRAKMRGYECEQSWAQVSRNVSNSLAPLEMKLKDTSWPKVSTLVRTFERQGAPFTSWWFGFTPPEKSHAVWIILHHPPIFRLQNAIFETISQFTLTLAYLSYFLAEL